MSTSPFYNSSWLTNLDAFLQAVVHFKSITAYVSRPLQGIDLILEQLITFAVTSAIAIALTTLSAKHNNNIQLLCKMFQKAFSLRECSPSPNAQTPSNPTINLATASSLDLASKDVQKR